MDTVQVRMLGGFSVERGGSGIDDQSNRMRKVWLLLAYLIYNRNSHVSQDSYLSLLRTKGGDGPADPMGNLKAMFFRARALLNQIDETAGHDLIIRKDGSYAWNTAVPLWLDIDEVERLYREGKRCEESQRLELYEEALALYGGDFLPKLSMEAWVMPIAAYYHRIYMEMADDVLHLLESRQRWADAAELCRKALELEPYSEELYRHLMRCKLAAGDRASVLTIYEDMSELLFSNFGVMPSDESRALYREAAKTENGLAIPVGEVREQLREPTASKGALFCEYDFFKLLYQAQARAVVRSGDAVHIALFSVHGQRKKELPRRSLDRAMENLKEQIVSNLRQGDVVTQCSASQLIAMLPQANYENSCMVADRVIKAFYRQYPHSPVDIHFSVQPLEPLEMTREQN